MRVSCSANFGTARSALCGLSRAVPQGGNGLLFVLALDPGKITGYVLAQVLDSGELDICACGAVPLGTLPETLAQLCTCRPVVVVEGFRVQPGRALQLTGAQPVAAEALGIIKSWCVAQGLPVAEQPSSGMKTVTKSLLETTGLWQKTAGSPHARDAARHLLLYCLGLDRVRAALAKKLYPNRRK